MQKFSVCDVCKHGWPIDKSECGFFVGCDAFPNGIPHEALDKRIDTTATEPCSNNIGFEVNEDRYSWAEDFFGKGFRVEDVNYKGGDPCPIRDESMIWTKNEEWYHVDNKRKMFTLTDQAPEEARTSFEKFKKVNNLDW